MAITAPTRPCSRCDGSGVELDPVGVGQQMRRLREGAKKSLRSVASAMMLSPPYISDLEHGHRSFNDGLIARYKEALK